MFRLLFILILIVTGAVQAKPVLRQQRQASTTTTSPSSSSDTEIDYQDISEQEEINLEQPHIQRDLRIAELLSENLTRNHTRLVLQKALDLLNKPATTKRIVVMHANNCSERSISAKYRWFKRPYLERFKKAIEAGGHRSSKQQQIEKYVRGKLTEARSRRLAVHEYNLRRWALEEANRIGYDNFCASEFWLHNFKKRNNVVSRKITELGNRAMNNQLE